MISILKEIYRVAGAKVLFVLLGFALMAAIRWNLIREFDFPAWAEVSAWMLLIFGVWWSRKLDFRFAGMIARLKKREALSLEVTELEAAKAKIEIHADRCERIGSILLPAILIATYMLRWKFDQLEIENDLKFTVKLCFEVGAIYLVGGFAGRLVAYGFLGLWLKGHGARVHLRPGHPDGAGGLKVVGDYYFYQAALVMMPVAFFGFWWVMIPNLRVLFGFAFLGFLLIEIAVFLFPMWFFHQEMLRKKEEFGEDIDELGCEVVRLREKAYRETDPGEQKSILTRCEALENRIKFLEALPEWPIDSGIRRRFAWGNLTVILVPTLVKLIFDSGEIHDVVKKLVE